MRDERKTPIAIFVSGTGTNMAALLYASRLEGAPYEIVLVASNRPDAKALELAQLEGIATAAHGHAGLERGEHERLMEDAVRRSGAQVIVLAGYMRILSDDFVTRWAGRIVNIHPSLLPKYKGLDCHARAIAAGDSHAGASVHIVTPELDAGEVIAQAPVKIAADDTPATLADRVRLAEHQLYPRALADFLRRPRDPKHLYSRVEKLALALPESFAQESHGSPGFRVGTARSAKFFAYFADRHHGAPHIAVLVRTSGAAELEDLVEQQPETYFKPAYYGASGWIGIILDAGDCDWDHVASWLERSWRSVAPARLTKLQHAAAQF